MERPWAIGIRVTWQPTNEFLDPVIHLQWIAWWKLPHRNNSPKMSNTMVSNCCVSVRWYKLQRMRNYWNVPLLNVARCNINREYFSNVITWGGNWRIFWKLELEMHVVTQFTETCTLFQRPMGIYGIKCMSNTDLGQTRRFETDETDLSQTRDTFGSNQIWPMQGTDLG